LASMVLQTETVSRGAGTCMAESSERSLRASTFAERFAADSAEAGLARTLAEQRRRSEALVASKDWDGALEAFEEMALRSA